MRFVRALIVLGMIGSTLSAVRAPAATYYVRQTVGDDDNDGSAPDKAWLHVSKLSGAMHAGDTAYVGPGLYREEITVMNDGEADKRITFIADNAGKYTGDPPGIVMITGAEPLDTSIFTPEGRHPGVYKATFGRAVWGLVEMDGNQFRYWRIKNRKELPIPEGKTEVDLVGERPQSYFYDDDGKVLYFHTSDGKPPTTHQMEWVTRGNGIGMYDKHYVTIIGFTFRHVADAGINFFKGSTNGVAIGNTSYGNRQGIRVYGASNISVFGNTFFRNENCGIYSALESRNNFIVGNTMYENIKGVRWSSQSTNGTASGNILFDNHEAGVSIENAEHTVVRNNVLANNEKTQLLVITTNDYVSEGNCFEARPDQMVADFYLVDHYKTLEGYQHGKGHDLGSRFGDCGPLPAKLDVHKLQEETSTYTERARKLLKSPPETAARPEPSPPPPPAGWWDWLRGLVGR